MEEGTWQLSLDSLNVHSSSDLFTLCSSSGLRTCTLPPSSDLGVMVHLQVLVPCYRYLRTWIFWVHCQTYVLFACLQNWILWVRLHVCVLICIQTRVLWVRLRYWKLSCSYSDMGTMRSSLYLCILFVF